MRCAAWPYGGRFPGGQLVYKGTWWYSTYYVPQYPNGPANGPNNVLHGGLLGPLADFRHSLDMGCVRVQQCSANSLSL